MLEEKQQGILYLVGIGPGDPELMTCKAVRVLEQTRVLVGPKARKNGSSNAVEIAAAQVDMRDKSVLELRFPMKKIVLGSDHDPEVVEAWRKAAQTVLGYLEQGEDVAFPTLGDPALYSTAFYLLHTLQELRSEIRVSVIPGITAMAACSARVCVPIGLGDDVVSIVPAAFDDNRLREILHSYDSVVLMKVFRKMDTIVPLLEELNLVEHAVLIERCGMDDQKIYSDVRETVGRELHYFSTLLIRKKEV
ncbi:MAG: precorrin-2 C(20)-methyltransferase [Desulfobulbus sp.]|nr:MAG: precorrin-2 C(20)-methyltransferase [Desulfobulbus sp.]RUM35937.1 MAG: precorrin-2 C(20)-methyltransferase [Desulfobulbus sp.]RUM41583.1 MAG: precorrin-2 C(20)-methyltransferase [Desulfobulbus sp.]